jgi:tetratricopeptide (TPR) repeat protein
VTEPPVDRPPDPATATGPAEFVERLRELRLWAGAPSLRRLRQLAGTTVDAHGNRIDLLPVSTASRQLRGDRLPRMEFVRAFVTACLRARGRGADTIAEQTERWHEAWLSVRRPGSPPAADPAPERRPATPRVPRELPPDVASFTGRAAELAVLVEALAMARHPGSVVISAIDGPGGVGKSALAIHAAHLLADRFPDGQLYVDLLGATAGLAPLEPHEVLGRFLRALGVPGNDVPEEVDEAAARFRTMVADRRLMLVLDNATDYRQVRPLLPGALGCRVLVTSRQTLPTLDPTHRVHLDVLPGPDAIGLLARVIGAERVAAEPAATAEVARRCGYLPLALRIAAARLAARPAWPIAALAGRLADEQHRLAELRDAEAGVQASFDVSHRQLGDSDDPTDQAAAMAFGLLGIWGGPDLALPVAARLLDRPEQEAERLLERLVDARLLETRRQGRYHLHDLLRLYARQRAALTHPEPERVAAAARALRFYVASAWRTLALLRPGDQRHARADQRWTGGGHELADPAAALSWLEAERPNLLAAVTQAAARDDLGAAAIQLAQALFGFFYTRRYWRDWELVNRSAIQAARRLDDQVAEAYAYSDLGVSHAVRGRYDEAVELYRRSLAICQQWGDRYGQATSLGHLGVAYTQLGNFDEASAYLQEALAIRRVLGDSHGEATARYNLGRLCWRSGRYAEALEHLGQSLVCYRALGDLHGQSMGLNGLACVYHLQGDYDKALAHLRRSLALNEALGNRYNQAADLDTIGTIHHAQGRYGEALDCFQASLAIARELGTRRDEAEVLRNAGTTLHALGRTDEAVTRWRDALAICEELRMPADDLRELLATTVFTP